MAPGIDTQLLNITAILQAAEQTESKAIHPGYGFLSENAAFATAWALRGGIDLSAYADSTVRFAFYFQSDGSSEYKGWYIDDIDLSGIQSSLVAARFDVGRHGHYPPVIPAVDVRVGASALDLGDLVGCEFGGMGKVKA